ncbi:MAG: CPBP family intramembrane metalloprotease [Kangiellaceae bacterium]|nr:CPBP family intramembrane metalloprotease [Kangiellaceae bacterium]
MTTEPSVHESSSVNPLQGLDKHSLLLAVATLILLSAFSVITLSISLFALGYGLDNSLQPLPLALSIFFGLLLTYPLIMRASKNYFRQVFIPQLKSTPLWLMISVGTGVVLALLVNQATSIVTPPEGMETTVQTIMQGETLAVVLVYVSVILFAPFFEEYLFRGLIFDGYHHRYGFFIATIVSSVIFMAFHLLEYYDYWVASVAITLLAIVLATIRFKSQSLLNPILCHMTYNLTIILLA